MQYGWAPTASWTGNNGVTGNFVPLQVDASGVLQATIAGAIFSGSLEINTDTLEAITLTGVLYSSGISGELASVTKSDLPSGYGAMTGFVHVNRAVVTSGYNPQFNSGAGAVTAVDNVNGGMLAVVSDMDRSIDSVTAYPPNATTASNYVPSGNIGTNIVTGSVLLSNPNRIAWGIQVIGSGSPLYVKFGTGPAGTGSMNLLLKGSAADYGADGGSFIDSPAVYLGEVSISGSTRFTVWEM